MKLFPTLTFITTAALSLVSGLIFAQNNLYSSFTIPASLRENATHVVRLRETEIEIDDDYSMVMKEKVIITLLSNDAGSYSYLFSYDDKFRTTKKMEGRVYDAAGQLIRESSKSDIVAVSTDSDGELTQRKNKYLHLPNATFPFTVEFYLETKQEQFFLLPSFEIQHFGEAVETAQFHLTTPANYGLRWKATNTRVSLQSTVEKAEKHWTATVKNLPAPQKEPFAPFFSRLYAEISLAPDRVKMEDNIGDFRNWNSTGAFYYDLNNNRDALSPAMQTTVQQLIATARTNREKIAALYTYLQQNYRYVSIQLGIGGIQTLPASFVEQKKYGDCKALTNYMKAMLKVVGIPAYQALIYGDDEEFPALSEDFSRPLFNHVVLYIPGEDMWLECTSQQAPLGYLGGFTAGHPSLLLTPEGGKLVQAPLPPANANQRHMRLLVDIDAEGNGKVGTQVHYSGLLHDMYRYCSVEKDAAKRDATFSKSLGVSVKDYQKLAFNADPNAPLASIVADYETRNYAKVSGKRLFIPVNKIKPFDLALPVDSLRQHPLQFTEANIIRDTVVFKVPAGYKVENAPAPTHISAEFVEYDLSIGPLVNQEIVAVRTVQHKPLLAQPEQYQDIRKVLLNIKKADGAQIVLVKE